MLPGPDWAIALVGLAVLGIVAWCVRDMGEQMSKPDDDNP